MATLLNRPSRSKSEAFLQILARNKLGFVILSIDVVGSTKLSQAVSDENYARIIAAAVSELSLVVPQFHGHILNYTGDGYHRVLRRTELHDEERPGDRLRAHSPTHALPSGSARRWKLAACRSWGSASGWNYGDAVVVTLGDPRTKQHKDIIGAVVNLAAKEFQSSSRTRDDRRRRDRRPEPARRVGESSFKSLIQGGNGRTRTPTAVRAWSGRVGRDTEAGPRVSAAQGAGPVA